jgi:hypothetical protein
VPVFHNGIPHAINRSAVTEPSDPQETGCLPPSVEQAVAGIVQGY